MKTTTMVSQIRLASFASDEASKGIPAPTAKDPANSLRPESGEPSCAPKYPILRPSGLTEHHAW